MNMNVDVMYDDLLNAASHFNDKEYKKFWAEAQNWYSYANQRDADEEVLHNWYVRLMEEMH